MLWFNISSLSKKKKGVARSSESHLRDAIRAKPTFESGRIAIFSCLPQSRCFSPPGPPIHRKKNRSSLSLSSFSPSFSDSGRSDDDGTGRRGARPPAQRSGLPPPFPLPSSPPPLPSQDGGGREATALACRRPRVAGGARRLPSSSPSSAPPPGCLLPLGRACAAPTGETLGTMPDGSNPKLRRALTPLP